MNKNLVLYLLAFCVFNMASAEIVVAGILGMIAQDTNVSVGTAGQLVTVYAIVIAAGSPILLSLTSRMERKKLLLLTFVIFVIGNLLAFFSPNFTLLMASRIVQAASAGVFTVVALTVGASMAAPERRGSAIGIIIMGASTALVVGVPLGTLIGEYWGWRLVFMFINILALFSIIGIAASVPKMESQESVSVKTQLAVLRDRRIISGLFITFFWVIGYQLLFTYISPFLQEAASLNTTQISAALFICGTFAVIGSRIGGYGADRWGIYRTLLVSLLLHAVSLAALPWVGTTFLGAIIILAVWVGSAYMTTPGQQYYLVSLSPNSSGLVLSLNNSVLQLGIAVGAGAGGWVVNQTSVMNLGWIGAISIVIGMFAVFYSFSLKSKPLKEA
ncbi:MFS transporter [Paenibacillus donghaensis]|uniref:MFS transporter n=1 Tax=Paenibacillus donghaensis TaxID=414771 RepID=UPI0018833105|nr:MFS transporter [Paenibacillus donghaensis]MBE9915513.1 MFS transporter [Paenibacillus donghaensis]